MQIDDTLIAFVGMAAGVGILLLIIIITITVICVVRHKRQILKTIGEQSELVVAILFEVKQHYVYGHQLFPGHDGL